METAILHAIEIDLLNLDVQLIDMMSAMDELNKNDGNSDEEASTNSDAVESSNLNSDQGSVSSAQDSISDNDLEISEEDQNTRIQEKIELSVECESSLQEQEGSTDSNMDPYKMWRKDYKDITCCNYVETVCKPSYRQNGGTQITGEGGLDGTGSTYLTHLLLNKLKELNILVKGKTVTDLGSGTGVFLTHVALFEEVKCIGIEQIQTRYVSSIIELRNLGTLFGKANLYFENLDILHLTNLGTDIVYAFNSVFTNPTNDHIIDLLTKKDCTVKHVILYSTIDLEDSSKGKDTEWRAMVDEDGEKIKMKMSLMLGTQTFTCKIYERITLIDSSVEATIDPRLVGAWALAGNSDDRRSACETVFDALIGLGTTHTDGSSHQDDEHEVEGTFEQSELGYKGTFTLKCTRCQVVWCDESEPMAPIVCRNCDRKATSTSVSNIGSSNALFRSARSREPAGADTMTVFFNGEN